MTGAGRWALTPGFDPRDGKFDVVCVAFDANPLADRLRCQPSTETRHCREFMPEDANGLRSIATAQRAREEGA